MASWINRPPTPRYWTRLLGSLLALALAALSTAQTVTSLTISPSTVIGGQNSTGTMTLSSQAPHGGAVVSLSVSQPEYTRVKRLVTFAQGATTANFPVDTITGPSQITSTVTATLNGSTQTANILVAPSEFVSSVSLILTKVTEGASSMGTVTLGVPAPAGGYTVKLASRNSTVMVPSTVSFAAGTSTGAFTATTSFTGASYSNQITASDSGGSASATLTVNAIAVVSVALAPASVVGGQSSTGTVTLSSAAPPGGIKIALSGSVPKYTEVNPTVTVTAGNSTATFPVKSVSVTSPVSSTVTATYGGSSANAVIAVTPPLPSTPANLAAAALSTTQVGLSWTESGSAQTGFYIQRIARGSSSWITVGTAPANATAWVDGSLATTTSYSYQVCAYSNAGSSPWDGPVSVTTLASTPHIYVMSLASSASTIAIIGTPILARRDTSSTALWPRRALIRRSPAPSTRPVRDPECPTFDTPTPG